MIIVQYIPARGTDTRERARAEFATIAQLSAVPWVVEQRRLAKTSFIRYSIAQGDTLMMEYKAANGTITFKDGAKSIGTVTLTNGQAALTTSALETGTHNLTAEYSGAANFTAAVSPAMPQSVSKSPATVTLASAFDAVRYGQAVTLSVTVSGGGTTPTGNVRFLNGSTTLGTV